MNETKEIVALRAQLKEAIDLIMESKNNLDVALPCLANYLDKLGEITDATNIRLAMIAPHRGSLSARVSAFLQKHAGKP